MKKDKNLCIKILLILTSTDHKTSLVEILKPKPIHPQITKKVTTIRSHNKKDKDDIQSLISPPLLTIILIVFIELHRFKKVHISQLSN